jgi:hypothetical protein
VVLARPAEALGAGEVVLARHASEALVAGEVVLARPSQALVAGEVVLARHASEARGSGKGQVVQARH